MTTDRITLPDVSDDEDRTLNLLLEQLDAKAPRNLLRASYYDGKRAIRQVSTVIPPQYYRLGITLGWSAKAVDMLARRCNIDGFVWPEGDLTSLGFGEFEDGNHLISRIKSGLVSSLTHGVSFLVNTRGDVSAKEPLSLLHVKDAMNATGEWNTRRGSMDNLLSVTGRDGDGKVCGLALYLDGVTITADKDGGKWSVDRSEHSLGVPVEPLVYKPSELRPLGASRISRPLMSIHDRAVREAIRMEGHMDVFSMPEMWMLGADETIFKNPDGSQKASFQIMLGRIKGIPDDENATTSRADVKQFPAASPEPHIAAYKQLAGEFSGEASIPLTSLGVSDMSNPTSADSYIASREDLIAESEGATDDWKLPVRRAVARGLAIQNGLDEVPAEWSQIGPKWRNPVYVSRAAAADAGSKQLGAVPWLADTEVGLELLGLDEQQIKRALADKRRMGGSAALRAITTAAVAGVPAVTGVDANGGAQA